MSVLDYKDREEFTFYELQICQMLMDRLIDRFDSDFAFLSEVGLKDIRAYWYSDSNPQVLGGFYLPSGNCIYVNREFVPEANLDSWSGKANRVLMVFPTIMHEMCHFWQSRKYGALYFLMQLPLIREIAIERQANRISDKLFDQTGSVVSSVGELARMKREYGFPIEEFDERAFLAGKNQEWRCLT